MMEKETLAYLIKIPNPNHRISSGAVRAADVDQDGDLDLFWGND